METPVIVIGIENITAYTSTSDDTTTRVNWTEPYAYDNSGVQTLTSSHKPGSLFAVGTTSVQYTSTDSSGNSVVEIVNVTVIQSKSWLGLFG